MAGTVDLTRDGPIATVTLSQPDKLNAMSRAMYDALGTIMTTLSADDTVRCVVLRGAGERAFCPGSDISEFDDTREGIAAAREYSEVTNPSVLAVAACPHPTIAQIHGVCVGGGMEIASQCDIRICGTSSRFGIPINRLGLNVDYDELPMLTDLIGPRRTLEMLLEGRVFGAAEAERIGLVTRMVPDEEVAADAARTAQRIAESAPLVNRIHKQMIRRLADPAPLTEAEKAAAFDCFESEDYRIGRDAFARKETPRFVGR
ncbi:enoyl-CoA hydratase-related protein [Acuticoccus sp. M5D2P5]|uniref:enoyl-CoA hydratase-related protein n=1 Tax=Acuticoccus kalidii TaxID=2910977 RepID=UPI001F2AD125|nr:enoyl-CoA hydratase-related protein [Acuticoccus kalidii]MCF3936154.1 enoyl-CoA hydratase-related protein [Acuticoccus kalidii]